MLYAFDNLEAKAKIGKGTRIESIGVIFLIFFEGVAAGEIFYTVW